uniref:Uncharacterized protein n=1 Tax=Davidia involucrata TaxID=16924 RepID=A0A5B6YQL8_DAVIN
MQHNIFTTMRSLKMMDGCKGTQVYALNPSGTTTTGGGGGGGGAGSVGEKFLHHLHDHIRVNSIRSKSNQSSQASNFIIDNNSVLVEALATYGFPQTDLLEPQIELCLKSVDFVGTLADVYRGTVNSPQFEKSGMYLEQCATFRGLSDPKLFRRSLRLARQHAVDAHSKIVLSAWLRFERREDELIGLSVRNQSMIPVCALEVLRMMAMLDFLWDVRNVRPQRKIMICHFVLVMMRSGVLDITLPLFLDRSEQCCMVAS